MMMMKMKLFLKVLVNRRSRNACQNVVAVLCQRILNNLNYPCPHANHCDFQTWCKKADSQKVIEAIAALPPFHIWCVLTFQMKSRSRASRSLFVAAKKCTIATGAEVSTAQHQINEQLILFKLSHFQKFFLWVRLLLLKPHHQGYNRCYYFFDPTLDWLSSSHIHFICNRRKKRSHLKREFQ